MKNSGKLHPKNRHCGRYDFAKLIEVNPALKNHVRDNGYGELSIDFFDPNAVRALNKALLQLFYGVEFWEIPPSALTPPIPSRADYIHYLGDLISQETGGSVKILDVGVGANCIYPIIGVHEYGWEFIGSDIEKESLKSAQQIVEKNPALVGRVELRYQPNKNSIFRGVINSDDLLEATICNPPFHDSAESAKRGTMRKLNNLKGRDKTSRSLNFGGQSNELWCEGGELQFIIRMIRESEQFASQCRWFTTLVSKEDNLPRLIRELKRVGCSKYRVIDMAQGAKKSRILAWQLKI